jgi:polysaccharide deacetylase family protein (PEP-CTERM system associated)
MGMPAKVHHITVDVEEFFHSTLLVDRVPTEQWDAFPRRAPRVVPWILERLAKAGSRATFFVLGWSAERDPELVREIHRAGHEVAAHSWIHRRVDAISPEAFREAVRRSKDLLEGITGEPVGGYRAPSFSIGPGCEWAFDILLDEGYRYDSSLFPIDVGPGYGYKGGNPDPHWLRRKGGVLGEVPPLSLELLGRRFPAAGGAYLRHLPSQLVTSALRQAETRSQPGTLYIHPWDIDTELEPLGNLPPLLRFRLFGGAVRARKRLAKLISIFPSRTIQETLDLLPDRELAANS